MLTHYSTSLDEPEAGLETARSVFPETTAGQDGMIITMRYPKEQENAGMDIAVRPDWYERM